MGEVLHRTWPYRCPEDWPEVRQSYPIDCHRPIRRPKRRMIFEALAASLSVWIVLIWIAWLIMDAM